MIKVLFLIGTLNGGGAEKILVDTVNNLSPRKYQITVQTILNDGIYKDKLLPHIRYKTIISFKKGLIRSCIFKFLFNICGCKFVHRLFVNEDYDYEISFLEGLSTNIISQSVNKKSKKYTWLHTDINCCANSYLMFGSEEKEIRAYNKFDKIFCVSEHVKESLMQKYKIEEKKLQVLYNIVDDGFISVASMEQAELPCVARPIFMSAGRLVKVKGYDRLLRVHKRLIDEGLLHSLVIIGDGAEKQNLRKYINENHLNNTAFLIGFQENPYKYFSKADLFVCSSLAEGFSTVVSEAIICGVPVLSTNVSGANEPLELPRCSVIVDNSEQGIYIGIKKLLQNPESLTNLRRDVLNKKKIINKEKLIKEFEKEVFNITE